MWSKINKKNKRRTITLNKKQILLGLLIIIVAICFISYESNEMSNQQYQKEENIKVNATMTEYDIHSPLDADIITSMHEKNDSVDEVIMYHKINSSDSIIEKGYPNLIDENNIVDEYRYQYINGDISESEYINKINSIVDNNPELKEPYSYLIQDS